jgi:hypothetical protein
MEVISHRGLWKVQTERNSLSAFARSFAMGFGAEIDVRDLDGDLVVSHDPPCSGALLLSDVLDAHHSAGSPGTLAVNIKADGLSDRLASVLASTQRWFAFDMSVPDMLSFRSAGLPFYTRRSEYEEVPTLLSDAGGVWMDCFMGDWWDERDVAEYLEAGKAVCLVSPELHGRPNEAAWLTWSGWDVRTHPHLGVCTDHPSLALQVLG